MARKERVTEVFDGDTFLTSVRKKPVRLNDVNTPEKRQQGYQDAKKALEKLIGNKEVTVDTLCRDKWGRPIADVKLGNQSVNRAMKKHQKK